MDESLVLKRFNKLVSDGIAFYDSAQEIVQFSEGSLTVSILPACSSRLSLTVVSFLLC